MLKAILCRPAFLLCSSIHTKTPINSCQTSWQYRREAKKWQKWQRGRGIMRLHHPSTTLRLNQRHRRHWKGLSETKLPSLVYYSVQLLTRNGVFGVFLHPHIRLRILRILYIQGRCRVLYLLPYSTVLSTFSIIKVCPKLDDERCVTTRGAYPTAERV